MMHSVQYFVENEVCLPDLIKLIPSNECNPEKQRYYAHLHEDVDPSVPYEERKSNNIETCERVSKEEVEGRIESLSSENPLV